MQTKKLLFLSCWLLSVISSFNLQAQVVISQVYGGGGNTGAPYTHDFIELFNRGTSPVSLNGLSLQYGSATGTGNMGANAGQLTELPNAIVQPGQYFLVQEGSGATGIALPSPDFIDPTPISMSATGGKVALVTGITSLGCNGGSAVCDSEAQARIIDLTGYGIANFFEGSGAAPAPSNTTSILRNASGCTDTNNNSADFFTGAPTPRNGNTTANPCASGITISISDATVTEGNNGTVTAIFTVNLSQPAPASISFDVTTADNTATVAGNDYVFKTVINQAIPAGASAYSFEVTINSDTEFEQDETFLVNLTNVQGATLTDAQGTGSITNDDTGPVTVVPIHDIQSAGNSSPAVNQIRTIEAVVVGDFQAAGQLGGFNVQEEVTDYDADILTSEGIFVLSSVPVNVGDKVQVSGTVTENFGHTQLEASSVIMITSGNTLPAVTSVVIPPSFPEGNLTFLERYEGMLVQFTQTLTVSGTNNLERFGELMLSTSGRLIQPTNFVDPTDSPAAETENDENNVAAVTAQQNANNHRSVILDNLSDGTLQAPATIPYIDPVTKTIRVGSTVTNATGILDFDFSFYRIRPTVDPVFNYAPRPSVPSVGDANVKAASFNVLNYFVTFGGNDDRGADNPQEFVRQKTKIIEAITQLNADVIGLIEIQNNGSDANSAIADLINGLNAKAGAGTYAYINDPATGTGTDVIKNAIIYKPAVVTPQGASLSDTDAIYNRYPIAQTFKLHANGEVFTFVVNHFKSKGSGSGPNADQGDGQGASNLMRRQQAEALLGFINELKATDPDILSVGDYNAYVQEDPMDILNAGGLVNLIADQEAYSYNFDSQSGSLDHALATPSMHTQVTGAAKWHINSDEPGVIDYNFENDFPPFGTKIQDLYEPHPYRSSDHDPVLVGLKLATPTISFIKTTDIASEGAGSYIVNLALSQASTQESTVTFTIANGTGAGYGTDYTTLPAAANNTFTISIPAGSSSATFTINLTEDQADEFNETVGFNITEVSSGLKLGSQLNFTLTIEDNDVPVINFKESGVVIKEGSSAYTVTLLASVAPVTAQQITVTINDYDLKYGSKYDYVTNPNGSTGIFILTLPAGQTTASFTVTPDKNVANKKDGPKKIDFTISKVSAGLEIGTPQTFELSIENKKLIVYTIWPNPTFGEIHIISNASEIPIKATLYNGNGDMLYSGEGYVEELSRQLSNKLKQSRRGIYHLQIRQADQAVSLPIIKW